MNRFSARMRCFRPCSIQAPLGGRHDAGDQIEGEDPLRAGAVAVDVERDPHVQERALGGLLPAQQLALGHRLDQLHERTGRRPRLASRARTSHRRRGRSDNASNVMAPLYC